MPRRRRVCRSVANTAAASVDATTDPSRNASAQERSNRPRAASPVIPAVTNVPTIDSTTAGTATVRSRRHEVESPPSYRIAASDTTPTSRASWASSNAIPPGPSEPRSIPIPRNATSAGKRVFAAPSARHNAPRQHRSDGEHRKPDVHVSPPSPAETSRGRTTAPLPGPRSAGDHGVQPPVRCSPMRRPNRSSRSGTVSGRISSP